MASNRKKRSSELKHNPAPAKDEHERAILDALDGHLDPDLFEKCAVDLLSSIYPSLAPVRGGSDGGFDGEIWIEDGKACPLVATTNQDFQSNLRRSLARATRSGKRPLAVFATSRYVTPAKRAALLQIAENAGISQLPIHDKDWFSSQLYRNSGWSLRLLGVTGRPSALVRDAPSQLGRFQSSSLIGRDDVLSELTDTAKDFIFVGGPGYGKTAVLRKFSEATAAYFIVDADRTALANAIRDLSPTVV